MRLKKCFSRICSLLSLLQLWREWFLFHFASKFYFDLFRLLFAFHIAKGISFCKGVAL